jgi:hypothetical protein
MLYQLHFIYTVHIATNHGSPPLKRSHRPVAEIGSLRPSDVVLLSVMPAALLPPDRCDMPRATLQSPAVDGQ